ncbi:NAD(P)H-dependent oxidoreductase [Bosea sp. WAO]|uniref:FMN-dependent NADH-azoreductase n=1 Tax=Bosea sp. WAO TaxID=406341 RepID=UPI000833B8C1|nr:NAD(P)H-dependent oxidoreductase [Bosea sp. WAO]
MPRLLLVQASPRQGDSASRAAAAVFLASLRERVGEFEIDELDLWREALPEFDGAALAAKYTRLAGRVLVPREAEAWKTIEAMVTRLADADLVLIATPMWNFGIPYKLKHWIDLVTQPGLAFRFDPATGYSPLLRSRPTLAIVASAGDYSAGPSWGRPDLVTPYLQAALRFIGLGEIEVVGQGPTIGPEPAIAAARDRAHALLSQIADSFAATLLQPGTSVARVS